MFEELLAHKIIELAPISRLDLSQIKKEKLTHTYCERIGDARIPEFRGFEFVYDYSYSEQASADADLVRTPLLFLFFGLTRMIQENHTFYHAMGPLLSEKMGQVLVDLDFVHCNLPNTVVTIFGVGSRRAVIFSRELITGVEVWHYAVPYDSS